MKYIPVKIRCNRKSYKAIRLKMFLKGFSADKKELCYYANIPAKDFYRLRERMNAICCTVTCESEFGQRSTSYRKEFFGHTKPVLQNRYVCAYCGRLLKEKDVTVDHIYPVHAAKTDINIQNKLKYKGFSDINDIKNLVAACRSCNRRKGTKMGIWILKGKLGRSPVLWCIRKSVRLAVIVAAAYLLIKSGLLNGNLSITELIQTLMEAII